MNRVPSKWTFDARRGVIRHCGEAVCSGVPHRAGRFLTAAATAIEAMRRSCSGPRKQKPSA